ncbi:MAG: hypothetical protein H8D74_01475 [Chloroflexi bacterium]|nr:hypothetical protein [Chloroflexota bacterium]
MTQDENIQAQGEVALSQATEAVAAYMEDVEVFLDAVVEFYAAVVEVLVPPLKRFIRGIYLLARCVGFYRFLLPFVGGGAAWWVVWRLPDWIVLRLPLRWVQLL